MFSVAKMTEIYRSIFRSLQERPAGPIRYGPSILESVVSPTAIEGQSQYLGGVYHEPFAPLPDDLDSATAARAGGVKPGPRKRARPQNIPLKTNPIHGLSPRVQLKMVRLVLH